jgi:hypothetical protein
MKNIFKILSIVVSAAAVFVACTKMDKLPFYKNGNAVTLSSDVTTITPSASDSDKTVLTLSWTSPNYATDSAHQKFIVEMDSSENFTHPMSIEVDGPLSVSFTGAQLNNMLANFGFAAGTPFKVNTRVTSSYANNNELYQSNVITVTMTPYLVPITLTPSSTNPIILQVTTGSSEAVSFSWNASNYGSNEIDYALQIDTVGGNFAHPQVFKYGTALKASIIQNDLNIAIINLGVLGGATKGIQFRVVSYLGSSYTNPLVYSAPVNITVTTYVPVPDNLYIVGDATPGGWANPVPVPSQQFTKVDAYSFSIIANLNAAPTSYLFLPVNGDWSHKYGGASATGGTLLKDGEVPGSNTPAPSTAGLYKITVNFQTNSYSVTSITVPSNLYIVGDATAGGWGNPVPTPLQQFTQISPGVFGIIANLNAAPASYLFLPVNGDWSHKYGGSSASGGTLLADGDVPGSNTPAPATAGLYKIIVNFASNTYAVTAYTGIPVPSNLYIVGDATAGGWGNPVPVPSQQFTQVSNGDFKITIPLTGGKSYLFLPVNGDWTHKYGGTSATGGTILYDDAVPGSNTPAPSSSNTYTIDANFITGTYSVQ